VGWRDCPQNLQSVNYTNGVFMVRGDAGIILTPSVVDFSDHGQIVGTFDGFSHGSVATPVRGHDDD